jgi:hypothetical protein
MLLLAFLACSDSAWPPARKTDEADLRGRKGRELPTATATAHPAFSISGKKSEKKRKAVHSGVK